MKNVQKAVIIANKFIQSGVGNEVKVSGNLSIEFETKLDYTDEELIIFVDEQQIEQVKVVLETTYNAMENKSPNLIPTRVESPYGTSFENIFKINTNDVNTEKPQCRICPRHVDIVYMRSHVATHILKGTKFFFFVFFTLYLI